MKDIQRQDLEIINRHSNIDEPGIAKIFTEEIYNTRETWQQFLRLFFITLGIGFTVSGIIFFFAYNWADLNKFVKIGLTELLIVATTCVLLFAKLSKTIRNIILTGAAALVGALFAVYGQVYQTGANAYDFFLGWTVFIALWVFISGFAPLWLLFLLLVNTTFYFYSQQVAKDWSPVFVCNALFLLNAAAVIAAVLVSKFRKNIEVPKWFLNFVSLAAITFATIGMVLGISIPDSPNFPLLIGSVIIIYSLGIWYSWTEKAVFYFAVIPFSIIIIISAIMLKNSLEEETILLLGVFIIVSITLVIKNLLTLQKKWKNEK